MNRVVEGGAEEKQQSFAKVMTAGVLFSFAGLDIGGPEAEETWQSRRGQEASGRTSLPSSGQPLELHGKFLS